MAQVLLISLYILLFIKIFINTRKTRLKTVKNGWERVRNVFFTRGKLLENRMV